MRREPEALIAPVSGVIAEGTPIAGQIAQPNAVVFQIIDPARLWVEALSFDAVARPRRAPPRRIGERADAAAGVPRLGPGRSQPVDPGAFRDRGRRPTGCAPASSSPCSLKTGEEKAGIAVPRAQRGPQRERPGRRLRAHRAERFEQRVGARRAARWRARAGCRGLEPGQRVVVQGAELLDHVR